MVHKIKGIIFVVVMDERAINDLARAIREQTKTVENFGRKIETLTRAIGDNTKALDELKTRLRNLNRERNETVM